MPGGDGVKILNIPRPVIYLLSGACLFVGSVIYVAASEAVAIITPILAWVFAAIGLIVVFAVAIDRYQWFALRQAEFLRDKTIVRNEEKRSNTEADMAYIEMVARAKFLAATLSQVRRGLIHPAALNDGKFSSFPSQVINQIEQGSSEPVSADDILTFEDIATKALASRGAGRFIVFGGMDSGKTTLAKHTVRLASTIIGRQGGQVYIIDPHAPKTVWPDGVTVIGAGMDYVSIRGFLDHVKADVKARYEAGCGDDQKPLPHPYKPNFIICEEWTGVIFALKAMKMWDDDDVKMFYMDSRKAGWGYLLVSHEYTTIALGLNRLGNLLSGVEYFITLDKNAITDEHSATLGRKFKDKEAYPLLTPGPFYGPLTYNADEAKSEADKADKYLTFDDLRFVVAEEPKPDENEAIAIAAYEELRGQQEGDASWNMVVKAAYGHDKTGKFYHDKLKKTLDKFGVTYQ